MSSNQHLGRWQKPAANERLMCTLCPRECQLLEGQRGFCFVRRRLENTIVLTSYGQTLGLCVDPVEKKPLSHFFPGSGVLSFGTAGCNLGCRFCQNWELSRARELGRTSTFRSPEDIAKTAADWGCTAVAFTYNDPVIFAEYAIDTAHACHAHGIRTIAVTAGYISERAREEFFAVMDGANIDLKGFTEEFYRGLCSAKLSPVLETLQYVAHSTTWLEVTTLLIPGRNDSPQEVDQLCSWVGEQLGCDVPLHFSAFHPDYRTVDIPATPPSTCSRARWQALDRGLHYVYTGNIADNVGQSTHCPKCRSVVIGRNGYKITVWALDGNRCQSCGAEIAGRFAASGPPVPGQRHV